MTINLKEMYASRKEPKADQISEAVAVREEVDFDKFVDFVGEVELNGYHALDEDELFADYMEGIHPDDIKFYLGTYRGHPIASIMHMHENTIFTPKGIDPYNLPNIGAKPEHVIKYVNREPFGVTHDELAGLLVVHGTTGENADDIMKNGIDSNEISIGHLGKAFYTTTEYKLALGYANDVGGKVIFAQIKPNAVIIEDRSNTYAKLEQYMAQENFPEILKNHGIDGIFCPAMSTIAIHNPEALTFINSFDAESLLNMKKNRAHDDAGMSR